MTLWKLCKKFLGRRYARVTLRHPARAGEIIADRGVRRIYTDYLGRDYVVPYDFTFIDVVFLKKPEHWRIEEL